MLKRLLLSIVLSILMMGCIGHVEPVVNPVVYSGPASVKTQNNVFVSLNTGQVTGDSDDSLIFIGSGYYMPMTGSQPKWQFNEKDQLIVVSSLCEQLISNKIVISCATKAIEEKIDTIAVSVNFMQTHHNPRRQEYTLDVVVIFSDTTRNISKKYHVVSSEGDSFYEKMTTDANEGKVKAAEKLLHLIITDLQEFLSHPK